MLVRPGRRADNAENGQIVRFGSTAGEHNFRGPRADQLRHPAARRLQALLGRLTEMMNARGVPVRLVETRHHRIPNFGGKGSGGVVIEVRAGHLDSF